MGLIKAGKFAFCSANDVLVSDTGVLNPHGCPVFSRERIEPQKQIFEEVINVERVRENTILNDQLSPWALPEFPLGMKWDKEKMHALISCMMHVRDVLLAIRGNYDKAYNGDLFIVVCSHA